MKTGTSIERTTGYLGSINLSTGRMSTAFGTGKSTVTLKSLATKLGKDFDGDVYTEQELRNKYKIINGLPYIKSATTNFKSDDESCVVLLYSDNTVVTVSVDDYNNYSDEMDSLSKEDVIKEFALNVYIITDDMRPKTNKKDISHLDLKFDDIYTRPFEEPTLIYSEADVKATSELYSTSLSSLWENY